MFYRLDPQETARCGSRCDAISEPDRELVSLEYECRKSASLICVGNGQFYGRVGGGVSGIAALLLARHSLRQG